MLPAIRNLQWIQRNCKNMTQMQSELTTQCFQLNIWTVIWPCGSCSSKTSQCITNIIRCKSDMRKIVVINTRTNTIIWNKSTAKKIKHYKKLFETSALFWYIAPMYQSSHFLLFPVTRRQWNVVSKLWQSQHYQSTDGFIRARIRARKIMRVWNKKLLSYWVPLLSVLCVFKVMPITGRHIVIGFILVFPHSIIHTGLSLAEPDFLWSNT